MNKKKKKKKKKTKRKMKKMKKDENKMFAPFSLIRLVTTPSKW